MTSMLLCAIIMRLLCCCVTTTHRSPQELKNNATINRDCNHYHKQHSNEINEINKMKQWFQNSNFVHHIDEIGNISTKWRLSEYYSLELPTMLNNLYSFWYHYRFLDESEFTHVVEQTLTAMHLNTISLPEFIDIQQQSNHKHNLSQQLQLLILSSRVLLHYFLPCDDDTIIHSGGATIHDITIDQQNIYSFAYHDLYPWLITDSSFIVEQGRGDIFETTSMMLFSYIYEHIFDYYSNVSNINLDTLHFHGCEDTQQLLTRLIGEFGFIPWNRNVVHAMRNDYYKQMHGKQSIFIFIVEFNRIQNLIFNDEFRGNVNNYNFITSLNTFFILDILKFRYPFTTQYQQQLQWKTIWNFLFRFAYQNYYIEKFDEFEALIKVSCDFVNINFLNDNIINESKRMFNDSDFKRDFIYASWNARQDWIFDSKQKIKNMIIDGIIIKSEYYWFKNNNKQKSVDEIAKLAKQNRIFDRNVLRNIILCVETKEIEYLKTMIQQLIMLRKDWNFDDAINAGLYFYI